MVDLRPLPNIAAIVVAFLRADPDVSKLVADRVFNTTLDTVTRPCVRVTRWGGEPSRQPWQPAPILSDHADLQVDVWGNSQAEAGTVAETVRAALAYRLPGPQATSRERATVTRVELGAYQDSPDDTYDPAWPRVIFDATVTYHP